MTNDNDSLDKPLPKTDAFLKLYYELKGKVQDDFKVMKRDITDRLPRYIDQKLMSMTLVNMAIRGEPGLGKSVLALEIMRRVLKRIRELQINKDEIDPYDCIASDQNEFLRLVREQHMRNVCITIDEHNPMGSTGANATTEIAEEKFFSNLCRIYYVHRIRCSPARVDDPNASVILDVIGKDVENKRAHVKVLYRNQLEGQHLELGTMWIDVSETLESKWYLKYEKKKLMRVNLLTERGIRDVRELEMAEIGVMVVNKLRPLIHGINKADLAGMIRLKAMNITRKIYKRPGSWFYEDELTKPIRIILDNLKNATKMKRAGESDEIIKLLLEEIKEAYQELEGKRKLLEAYRTIK